MESWNRDHGKLRIDGFRFFIVLWFDEQIFNKKVLARVLIHDANRQLIILVSTGVSIKDVNFIQGADVSRHLFV